MKKVRLHNGLRVAGLLAWPDYSLFMKILDRVAGRSNLEIFLDVNIVNLI